MKEIRVRTQNVLNVKDEILNQRSQFIDLEMDECQKKTILTISDLGEQTRYVFDDFGLFVLTKESIERVLSEKAEFIPADEDNITWVRPSDSKNFEAELVNRGDLRCILVKYANRTVRITYGDASKKAIRTLKEILKFRPDLIEKVEKELEVANKLNAGIAEVIKAIK